MFDFTPPRAEEQRLKKSALEAEEAVLSVLADIMLQHAPEEKKPGLLLMKKHMALEKAAREILTQYADPSASVDPAQQIAALHAVESALSVLTDFLTKSKK